MKEHTVISPTGYRHTRKRGGSECSSSPITTAPAAISPSASPNEPWSSGLGDRQREDRLLTGVPLQLKLAFCEGDTRNG